MLQEEHAVRVKQGQQARPLLLVLEGKSLQTHSTTMESKSYIMITAKTHLTTAQNLLTAGKPLLRLSLSITQVKFWKMNITKKRIFRPLFLACGPLFKSYEAFKFRHSSSKLMSGKPLLRLSLSLIHINIAPFVNKHRLKFSHSFTKRMIELHKIQGGVIAILWYTIFTIENHQYLGINIATFNFFCMLP